MIQAILFYLPRLLWTLISQRSGLNVATVTSSAMECHRYRHPDPDTRDRILRYMVKQMGGYLLEQIRTCRGCHLLSHYLIIKMLYVANALGQLLLLDAFLDKMFSMYGLRFLLRIFDGQPQNMTSSARFPSTVLCDFTVRQSGNIHRHTVQCSLPMNFLNEGLFVTVWVWLALMTVVTIYSLLRWMRVGCGTNARVLYIKSCLLGMGKIQEDSEQKQSVGGFVQQYLGRDGALVIRLVADNSSELIGKCYS